MTKRAHISTSHTQNAEHHTDQLNVALIQNLLRFATTSKELTIISMYKIRR